MTKNSPRRSTAGPRPATNPRQTTQDPKPVHPLDGGDGSLVLLGSIEQVALLSLTLHEQLEEAGNTPMARIARVIYLKASADAERIAEGLGLEANLR